MIELMPCRIARKCLNSSLQNNYICYDMIVDSNAIFNTVRLPESAVSNSQPPTPLLACAARLTY